MYVRNESLRGKSGGTPLVRRAVASISMPSLIKNIPNTGKASDNKFFRDWR